MNLEPSDIYVVASLLSNIDDRLSERWDLCVWIYYWCMVVEDALFCLWYFLMRYLWSLLIFGPLLSSLGHIVHFTLLLVQYNLSSLCYLVFLTFNLSDRLIFGQLDSHLYSLRNGICVLTLVSTPVAYDSLCCESGLFTCQYSWSYMSWLHRLDMGSKLLSLIW